MRILIVEDEKYIARSIAEVLKKDSFVVDLAHDGEYGLDCALTEIYDVIVLDIMLPKKWSLRIERNTGREYFNPCNTANSKGRIGG